MTPDGWQDLLRQRARRLETKQLGNIRRVSWRSADARMLRRMERSQPRDVVTRVYNEYLATVNPSLTVEPSGASSASWERPDSRLNRRLPRGGRRDLVRQIAAWAISPIYSYQIDRYHVRSHKRR